MPWGGASISSDVTVTRQLVSCCSFSFSLFTHWVMCAAASLQHVGRHGRHDTRHCAAARCSTRHYAATRHPGDTQWRHDPPQHDVRQRRGTVHPAATRRTTTTWHGTPRCNMTHDDAARCTHATLPHVGWL